MTRRPPDRWCGSGSAWRAVRPSLRRLPRRTWQRFGRSCSRSVTGRSREAHAAGLREGEAAGRSLAAAEIQPVLNRLARPSRKWDSLRARFRREAEGGHDSPVAGDRPPGPAAGTGSGSRRDARPGAGRARETPVAGDLACSRPSVARRPDHRLSQEGSSRPFHRGDRRSRRANREP